LIRRAIFRDFPHPHISSLQRAISNPDVAAGASSRRCEPMTGGNE
jgi:hypothetical protein